MGSGLLDLPGVAAGQQRRTGGTASRRGGECVPEIHALAGHAIECRRVDCRKAGAAGQVEGLIVGDRDQHIGTPGFGGDANNGYAERDRGDKGTDQR